MSGKWRRTRRVNGIRSHPVSFVRRVLDTPEDRQKVAVVFTKETKETFDVERIHTWFRNHKKKNKGGGTRGRVVRKVRHNSHLSHGEIVLVPPPHLPEISFSVGSTLFLSSH